MRYAVARWALLVCIVIGVIATAVCASSSSTPRVVPVDTLKGQLYQGLSATWWQWEFSLPYDKNPWFDDKGKLAGNGQCGPIFFLTGSFTGEKVDRCITIPTGKYLFFPIINAWADNIEVNPPMTFKQLQATAASYIDPVTKLYATVDGKNICNLFDYRVKSKPFAYWLPPEGNVIQVVFGLDYKGWICPAASDGYWLLLEPLPEGKHILTFGGGTDETTMQDVTYTIKVKKNYSKW